MKRKRTAFNHLAVIGRRFGVCGSSGAIAAEPPAPFVGPLDDYATGATGMWSLGRRVLSSYTGSLIRVRESAGNTEQDIGYDANGNLDEVALLAFVGSNSGYIRKVYDQSGGTNHLIQATSSNQPAIVISGTVQKINGAPIATGLNKYLTATNAISGAFALYGTLRNARTPAGNGASIVTVGNVNASALGIIDFTDYGTGVNATWIVQDSPSFNAYNLVAKQNTWSTLVINNNGSGSTKFRGNDTELTEPTGNASADTLRFGEALDMHLEIAEAALYSGNHASSGTVDAIQAILKNWIAPALALLMINTVDNAVAGQNATLAKPIYSTQDHVAPSYVRNTSCAANAYASALTALSPWNSDGAHLKAGVLISPRHVMFATHYTPALSSTIRFVKTDNTLVTRTISAVQALTDTASLFPDITIAKLDSDVPAGIDFARVFPVSFTAQLSLAPLDLIPCFAVNQSENLVVFDVQKLPSVTTASQRMEWASPRLLDAIRYPFYTPLAGGDSGSPLFTIIDGKLILLALATSTTAGTHVAPWHTAINAAMAILGGGYSLTDIDLSSFGSY
jgi:hypothetical protein